MDKIPTLLVRDTTTHKVTDEVSAGCGWVFAGEGIATEKLDGTNVLVQVKGGYVFAVYKRHTPKGEAPGYLRCTDDDPSDKWIMDAARATRGVKGWRDGHYPCEAIGPRIQGNPLGLGTRRLVRLDLDLALEVNNMPYRLPRLSFVPDSVDELREYVVGLDSVYSPGHPAEGVVFHHPDTGQLAKIKRRDFMSEADYVKALRRAFAKRHGSKLTRDYVRWLVQQVRNAR